MSVHQSPSSYPYTVPKFWWFWFPLLFLCVQAVMEITIPAERMAVLMSEFGVHELIQFTIIAAAFLVAIVLLWRMDKSNLWHVGWILLAAICCLYVAGEEASWGQHVLEWDTPEFWAQVNDQNETNFHNTSSWLDQKPRLLLLLAVMVGGFLFPLIRRWKPHLIPARFESIYPPEELMGIAAGLVAIYVMDNGMELFTHEIFVRSSEVEELYMFYFVLLYLLGLFPRFVRPRTAPQQELG